MNTESEAGASATAQGAYGSWGQRVGGLAGLSALLRALDVDAPALLASAGLAGDALDQPDKRIAFETFGRLLDLSAERAGYVHFGLTAGRMWHLEDLGALGELVRHSATVGEAVETATLYQHLNSEGGLAFLARHGGLVEIGYAIYYPGIVGARQIYDFTLASMFNFLRELCGAGWLPCQVLVPHARPDDAVHFRNFFKIVPQFDSEVCALRFPAHWMDHRIEGADPERRKQALSIVRAQANPDVLQQVYRALRNVLLNGGSSGNDVADALSMHRRTLNRRLQQYGTTFQNVLDQVRCEVARQLLCYSQVALDDIAASLGYAGVSPFMRSFRRWTGLSPGRLRRLAVKEQFDAGALVAHVSPDGRGSPTGAGAYGLRAAHPAPPSKRVPGPGRKRSKHAASGLTASGARAADRRGWRAWRPGSPASHASQPGARSRLGRADGG